MTPLQLARQECSNHTERGACLGLDWADDGTPISFGCKDKCTLKTERCAFFESSVLAAADMPTACAETKERVTKVKIQYLKRILSRIATYLQRMWPDQRGWAAVLPQVFSH